MKNKYINRKCLETGKTTTVEVIYDEMPADERIFLLGRYNRYMTQGLETFWLSSRATNDYYLKLKEEQQKPTVKEILSLTPVFILSYDKSQGILADSDKEIIGCDEEYIGQLTIQYHSISDNACLSFTIYCLVQTHDDAVSIEQMNYEPDSHSVYINNIKDLPNGNHWIGAHDLDEKLHVTLKNLIENQPIHKAPEHFINEAW